MIEEEDIMPSDELSIVTIDKDDCEINEVEVGDNLDVKQKSDVFRLLDEFKVIFSTRPGHSQSMKHHIEVTSNVPIKKRAYPLPFTARENLKKEI